MVELVWLVPALPLFGFVVLLLTGHLLGEPQSGWVATVAAGASFIATAIVFVGLLGKDAHEGERSYEFVLFEWLPAGSLKVEAGFLVDPLSVTMALFVTGVGALIHLYSIGYMHGDQKYSKFFLYLNLFLFSMLMLVFGNNLVVTFLGWEGVGACSYLLISFWHHRESAATAGKKAFVTNRVGDWGFMIATFAIWSALGTVTYTEITTAPAMSAATGTAVSLLLFVAAAGKSAQLPLYVWLPDAMEGPTPVSAMVHAATMVTSGVYLLVRMNNVLTDDALIVIAVIGGATALFAALCAVAQHDIKRVLAYSTVSQLGYMFLAIGSGAYVAAIFHVITHAFFKALLFLGSGSVIHGMHDEQDIRKMGALRIAMPITATTFIIGWLAIAGVPPFAGFWSKDEILLAAWEQKNIGPLLWAIGLVTALLTAYYMSRQVILVFFGDQRWDEDVHPHESAWTMTTPLCILAGAAIVGGAINLPLVKDWLVLEHFLEPIFHHPHHFSSGTATKVALAAISVLAGLTGIAIAVLSWLMRRIPTDRLEPEFLENAMYVDSSYARIVGGPGTSGFQRTADFDQQIVDGGVNGVGRVVMKLGQLIRPTQSGYMRNYAAGIALGALAILVLLAWGLL
ncbi:MAG: NADH-quinone oxidoreductase subunit L [Actinomycetota bacterium]|nr:NADH-quinone oxidoreductase subunit L [Acidimicrobiaceae bacterium]MEC7915250.1 NADH-quinone oxidoreductase subunit L [Actinomycetota bacterium]MEC9059589.1 NADH-quinone oxidoreductase subunit L [Actinomycetota bacterium]|tara:strand:+ start:1062 stop:2936 length:1875 start_codon:yes stop_codon:yes gene_type:complete